MANDSWPGARAGSTMVEVYNEGLIVMLYDESHLPELEQSGADFSYGASDAEIGRPLKQLSKNRTLAAYELVQDDPVSVEVIVGGPLTRQELKVGRWQRPQVTALRLPSGVLRIDTANTFPLDGDSDDESEEAPGRLNVPPGEYVLTLYRLDWDKLETEGLLGEDGAWNGPGEILVLTPVADAKPVKTVKPLLRVPGVSMASWLRKYRVEDGVCHGRAFARVAREACSVNLDRKAAEQLNLTPGSLLRVEVQGLVIEAVYLGDHDGEFRKSLIAPYRSGRAEFGVAYRALDDPFRGKSVFIWRSFHAQDFPVRNQPIPATITVLETRFELPDELLRKTPRTAEQSQLAEQEELAELDELFDEL